MSANMAAWCWSGDQAVGLGRRPLPDSWFGGINRTQSDLHGCQSLKKKKKLKQISDLLHGHQTDEALRWQYQEPLLMTYSDQENWTHSSALANRQEFRKSCLQLFHQNEDVSADLGILLGAGYLRKITFNDADNNIDNSNDDDIYSDRVDLYSTFWHNCFDLLYILLILLWIYIDRNGPVFC